MLSARWDHSQPGTKQREHDREEGQKKMVPQQFPYRKKELSMFVCKQSEAFLISIPGVVTRIRKNTHTILLLTILVLSAINRQSDFWNHRITTKVWRAYDLSKLVPPFGLMVWLWVITQEGSFNLIQFTTNIPFKKIRLSLALTCTQPVN